MSEAFSVSMYAGPNESVIERRTTEVSNFLDMLRSASVDNTGSKSDTSCPEWKVGYLICKICCI